MLDLRLAPLRIGMAKRVLALALAVTAVVVVVAPDARAQRSLSILAEVVEVLGAAGDSVARLVEGIERSVQSGARTYDELAARRTKSRLTDIFARNTDLMVMQNVLVLRGIEGYLENPTPERWQEVTSDLTDILQRVQTLLAEVRAERSDFVLEAAYQKMLEALSGRATILDKLTTLDPPTEPAELALLQEAAARYERLMSALGEANGALAEYLKEVD